MRGFQRGSLTFSREARPCFYRPLSQSYHDDIRIQRENQGTAETPSALHGRVHPSERAALPRRTRTRQVEAHEGRRGTETKSACCGPVESVFAGRLWRRG